MEVDPTLKTSFDTQGWPPPSDLGTSVVGLVNAVVRGMSRIVAAHGLTYIDFGLLRLFLGSEEWTTTQLAQAMPIAPSGISRSVSKLVDKGLIRRRRLRSDRRIVVLTLTEKGKTLTQELQKRVQAYDSMLCEGVSEEEMAALVSVSIKVLTNFTSWVKT